MIGEDRLDHHCKRFADAIEEDLRAGCYGSLDSDAPHFYVAERRLGSLWLLSTFDPMEWFVTLPDDRGLTFQ